MLQQGGFCERITQVQVSAILTLLENNLLKFVGGEVSVRC